MLGFESATFDLCLKVRRSRRSRRYSKDKKVHGQVLPKKPTLPKKVRPFKFGIEVPKTWKDVLRIDSDAGNRPW